MWQGIQDFFAREVIGITVGQLTGAFVAVLAGFIGRAVVTWVLKRLAVVTSRSRTRIDDLFIEALDRPAGWAVIACGIYVALQILPLPSEPVDIVTFADALFKGVTMLLLIWFGIRLSDRLCEHWATVATTTESKLDDQAIPIIQKTVKVFLVLVGASLFLQNMGYSVGSLIAGLGLGGAALALASKDTLANLFGAIVIFWDRPFEVGDWVDLEGVEGTVEEVGLRTTRIRTFANALVTLPNMKLTTASITNWSRMQKRRIKMTIGVTYDSSPEQVEAGVKAIQDLIATTPEIRDDFYLVRFDAFGPSSLDIFVYCFTSTTVWAEFLAVKEKFLLDIMRKFKGLGLSFAFPTQTVHVATLPEGRSPERRA
jgi:MscS family membrane protein